MTRGDATARDLVAAYLQRIATYDQAGPAINAFIALNPRAMDDAAVLDRERASGKVRGPLHGIPVVVKDNFDMAGLPTTGGSIALATLMPARDSAVVEQLRERRRRHHRQDQPARARRRHRHRQLARRADAESVRSGTESRRIERRDRRGDCREFRGRGDGIGHVRIDSHSGVAQQPRRAAPQPDDQHARVDAALAQPGRRRAARPQHHRSRADARRDDRRGSSAGRVFRAVELHRGSRGRHAHRRARRPADGAVRQRARGCRGGGDRAQCASIACAPRAPRLSTSKSRSSPTCCRARA